MTTTTTLEITGLSCQDCVGHITAGLKAISGVKNVSVRLEATGTSVISVISDDALDRAAIEAAVGESGEFQLITIR